MEARCERQMKKLFLTGIAALFLATGAAHAANDGAANRQMLPAICFVEITNQNAERLMKICGDLSDCSDRGDCEELEKDKQAHIKAGRLRCDNKKSCSLVDQGARYAEKDYIWDCASYRFKWEEDRSWGRSHGYKTLADACVKRYCRSAGNWAMCANGNLGYVPRKLRRIQLRELGRVPQERYVKDR